MATSRDAILAACLQILGVSPTVNPDYDLTVRAALLRVLLSGLTIDGTGVISTTQPINVPINVSSATGTLAVGHGGTGLTTVAVNRLLYASALDTIAALASTNNGVLVTNGSGVPSISVTLPSGLTITAPIFSGSIGSDLLFTDATFDIGKSAATRPRDLFLSRNATIGGTTTFGGNILSDLLFTDATFDLGKTGATRPRDGFFSRNLTAGGTLNITGTSTLAGLIGGWTVATTTSTGTQNDFAPGLVGHTVLRCNNATLLTIDGFTGGADGQRLVLQSIGAGQVDLAPQAAGSTAGNRLLNYATSGNTSLAAGVGTAEYVYDATTARWRLVQHEQGAWITRTFAAGNYTASAGTWTVASASRDAYWLKGRTLLYAFSVSGTTSTTPVTVKIAVPGAFTAASASADVNAYYISANGSGSAGTGYVQTSSTTLYGLQQNGNTAFGAGTVTVLGQLPIEVL